MTQEQKVKAYDEALKRARESLKDGGISQNTIDYLTNVFPELAEPEDERIKKEIIYFLSRNTFQFGEDIDKYKSWIAWLEKQGEPKEYTFKSIPRLLDMIEPTERAKAYSKKLIKTLTEEGYHTDAKIVGECLKQMNGEVVAMAVMDEQKPIDKIEPKFNVGDWYQCIKDFFGKGVTFDKNTAYYCAKEGCLQNEYGCHIAIVKDLYDNFKLWTIQDAKDGDVLQLGRVTVIFKEYIGNENCKCYCSVCNGEFEIPSQDGDDNSYGCYNATPATKEQRDLLFQKMKEAGYKWDAEKKELKKIGQKTAWSEGDEHRRTDAIYFLETAKKHYASTSELDATIDWLKAIKERMK